MDGPLLAIAVEPAPFDPLHSLAAWHTTLAAALGDLPAAESHFIGRVRPTAAGGEALTALELEHYPGMTEAQLHSLASAAAARHGAARRRAGKKLACEGTDQGSGEIGTIPPSQRRGIGGQARFAFRSLRHQSTTFSQHARFRHGAVAVMARCQALQPIIRPFFRDIMPQAKHGEAGQLYLQGDFSLHGKLRGIAR